MIASTIQRQVPIGSSVTFVRRDGRRVSGVLSEIGRDHITVEHDRQLVTVLLDMVTGWEVETDSADSADSADTRPISGNRSVDRSGRMQSEHDTTASRSIRTGSRPRKPKIPQKQIPQKPKWERLYQDAALANTEGRFDDARRLFRQAIEAGGGAEVHAAFFKMELKTWGLPRARPVIQAAVDKFGDAGLFDLYGSAERKRREYRKAEEVFRKGLALHGKNISLRRGLAQTLVQIGSEESLREAGRIFHALEKEGKLYKKDALYQRFTLLKKNPRINKIFEFFQAADIRARIAKQADLPSSITDIVVDIENAELMELFGLSGSFLVRCFKSNPSPIQLNDLAGYLQKRGPQDGLVLRDGGRVALNPALAFVSVQDIDTVHDQVMRILSENQAPVVPLDDAFLQDRDDPVQSLQRILTDYLGRRDLYNSTHPVSGRRFFGREQLLVQLGDALRSGQFLGIYGLRKIGKTSLVYQLRDVQLKHDAVAYVDLQASLALTGSCDALYWEMERALFLHLSNTGNSNLAALLRLGREDKFNRSLEGGAEARAVFAEDIRRLLDTMAADTSHGIARMVIILDELERILPLSGQPGVTGYLELFGLLRGLAQTESYRGKLSCVVVAANAAISERGYWEGRENPVFAFYKSVFIPSLSEEECATMIRELGKGMSVYWKPEAISTVFSETGGHPFFTRTLCSYIAQRQKGRPLQVTQHMVDEHILPFLRDQGHLMGQVTELVKTHFPEEARALQQIVLGEAPSCLADETLRHLLGYHLVTAENDGYRVTLNLLHRWMRRRAGLRE